MNIQVRTLLTRAVQVLDITALVLALGVTKATSDPAFLSGPISARALLDFSFPIRSAIEAAALVATWHAILSARGLYSSRRLSRFRTEARKVVVACGFTTVATAMIAWLITGVQLRFAYLAVFLAASIVLLVGSRAVLRGLAYQIRLRGRNLRHLVIVGTNRRAQDYAAYMRARPEMGFVVAGFVDDPSACQRPGFSSQIIADFESFPEFLRGHVVDEVAIFVPVKSFYERICRIVAACQEQGITTRIRADLFDLTFGDLQVEQIPGLSLPLATVRTGRMYGWPMVVKRLVDVAGATALLVLAAPVLLGAAVAIRLTSPGPILFVQERLGLNKHRFGIKKFRTMVPDAERMQDDLASLNEVSGPVFKIRNDPRTTPLGRFLRRTSIDELPQLVNVLKGEMSLVGPRPLPVRDWEGFSEDVHRRRFSVRPGLTCLWQVSGRTDVPFESWMRLDLQYIDGWSLWLDLAILARTVPAVFRGTGV